MRLTVLDARLRRQRPGDRYASAVTDFRKSCGSSACVEVDRVSAAPDVLVRDSKDLSIEPLRFTPAEWDAFLEGAKAGEYDI